MSTRVADLQPMMRSLYCEVIILQKDPKPTITRNEDVIWTFLVADASGSVVLTLWGKTYADLKAGDILRIQNGEVRLRLGRIQLAVPKHGTAKRIGEDLLYFSDKPNVSEYEWEPDPRTGRLARKDILAQSKASSETNNPPHPSSSSNNDSQDTNASTVPPFRPAQHNKGRAKARHVDFDQPDRTATPNPPLDTKHALRDPRVRKAQKAQNVQSAQSRHVMKRQKIHYDDAA
ncbi:hypothetical protein BZG36_01057 [Bifiguratus adelaidae]|uniref:OB domain-containing protein n=1 Tax=Bifiguratus adelaidae TaxID=1938954 RepID=A0A261Y643_9FUNG|nr:hypothetical protein BZG36_01057 [Bifiguratus adelaidae]